MRIRIPEIISAYGRDVMVPSCCCKIPFSENLRRNETISF